MRLRVDRLLLLAGIFVLAGFQAAMAETTAPADAESAAAVIEEYCLNITDKASEARTAWQSQNLKDLEVKLDTKISELEAKRIEVQGWVERQDAIGKAANAGLVEI